MTFKKILITTGTVSLKALRALCKGFLSVMAGVAYVLSEGMKYASSAEEDSDEDKPYGHEIADYHVGAAEHHFEDGWGS